MCCAIVSSRRAQAVAGALMAGWLCLAPAIKAAEGEPAAARTVAGSDEDEPGLGFEAVYTGEVWRNTTGGLRIGERYLDNLDLLATWNGSDRPGGGRSRAQLYVLYNNGAGLTDELIGDLQTVSNIDAPEAWRLYEAWYEYGFANASSLRFGLYDLNSEFDTTETGGLFINELSRGWARPVSIGRQWPLHLSRDQSGDSL